MTLKEEAVNSQGLCHLPLEKRSKFEDFWAATWLSLCECYSAPKVGKKAKVSFSGKPFQEMQGYPRWIQHCTQQRQLEDYLLDNQSYVFTKSCSAHTQRNRASRARGGICPWPSCSRLIPGDRSAQETLIAGGGLKLGTQRNGAPAPAPPRATQHSPRGRVWLSPWVRSSSLTHLTLLWGILGLHLIYNKRKAEGEKPKAEKGRGPSALWSTLGGKLGLSGHAQCPSMQSGLFHHLVLFFWASGLKPDSSEDKFSSLGGVCDSETERKQNLKDAGSSKPPAVLFWEADTFLTRLPSKRQSRTWRLRTRTPLPGRGIILQLHKVTIRDTLLGLGWIWNTAEGGLNLQGTWSHLVFMNWGYSPKHQPSAEVAAGFLHKPLALPQGCFRDRQKVPVEEIFAPEMVQIKT